MRYRSNSFYCKLILILTVLLAVIFYACTGIIKLRAAEMIEQEQVRTFREAERRDQIEQEKETLLACTEPEPVRLLTLEYSNGIAANEETQSLAVETSEATEMPQSNADEHDVELLACVIYQEAGGDACCDMCRRRVADIVLNRVNDPRYAGTTIEEILTDGNPAPQWGLYSVTGVVWSEKASLPGEQAAVERAYRIAREVLEGQHSDLSEDYIWCAEFPQGTDVITCDGIYFGK